MSKPKIPVPSARKTLSDTAGIITKTILKSKASTESSINSNNASDVTNSINDKLRSNQEILKLFPDVEISIQILVSSILAPNDLISTRLRYTMPNLDIPNSINSQILDIIRLYVNKNYKLESKLSTIIREALFTKGAYIEAIIPGLDIINLQDKVNSQLSVEELMLGSNSKHQYLNTIDSTKLSVEAEIHETLSHTNITPIELTVTDDSLLIDFTEDMSNLAVSKLHLNSVSTESARTLISKSNFNSFMRNKKTNGNVITISTDNNSGRPMVIKLPVSSVLPIHLTGDPSKHIGYIVILDEHGIPITDKPSTNGAIGGGKNIRDTIENNKSSIIKKAADALKSKLKDDIILKGVDDIYINALVTRINSVVARGKLSGMASAPDHSDLYQMVFARALKNLKTKMLYIPKDNLTYFAFEYRDNGTGKSLLEKSVMLFSIRAANLFTRIMANIKNSITTTKVSATLEDTDPDQEHTRELIINEAMKSERAKYPIGVMSIPDLVDWAHKVGYRFDIKGSGLPDINIDVADDTRSIAVPDESFDEMIQEHIIMSFGLKKDMVLAGYSEEFATTVVANNILFAKRVTEYQNLINPEIGGYVKRVLLNDSVLKNKILDVIISNMSPVRKLIKKGLTKEEILAYSEQINDDTELSEYIYTEYTRDILVELPAVSINREEGTLDELSTFTDMLDTYLPMIISSETLPMELVGDLSDKIEDVTMAIKTILIKNWMDEKNFLPDLTKFMTLDNSGAPKYDILSEYHDYITNLSKAILPGLKKLKKYSDSTNKKLDKIDNAEEPDDEPTANAEPDVSENDIAPGDGESVDAGDTPDTGTAPNAEDTPDASLDNL